MTVVAAAIAVSGPGTTTSAATISGDIVFVSSVLTVDFIVVVVAGVRVVPVGVIVIMGIVRAKTLN